MKTLNEVTQIVGMTRRVIQEYEKAGLAKTPTTTNKYGYLLYDEQAIDLLWQIRFYRELGFDKKEIKKILSDPAFSRHDILKSQIELLERKKEDLEHLIETAKAMDELGVDISCIHSAFSGLDEASYNELSPVMGTLFKINRQQSPSEDCFNGVLSEEDEDVWFSAAESVIDYWKQGLSYQSEEVQSKIRIMHNITSKEISDSILLFSWCNMYFSEGSEVSQYIDEAYGKGASSFLFEACRTYCFSNANNETDALFNKTLESIGDLGIKKYPASSEEVQREVSKLHKFYSGIHVISPFVQLQLLENLGNAFGSKAYKELIDNGAEKGIAWFISRSIQIYCEHQKVSA